MEIEERRFEMNVRDFMKITKAEITVLIDIVAVTGFLVAPSSASRIILLVPLLISGTLASMSASVFNNVYDVDIDSRMKRTLSRNRIIHIGNRRSYLIMGIVMVLVSLPVAYFAINPLTSLFILGGFLSYVFLYTIFLKRRTTWNIVIGGIAGSFPALAGWAAVTGSVSFTSLFIAFLVFLWTPTHFWSLAAGNTEDYSRAEVPMLPAVVGIKRGSQWIFINTLILVLYSILPIFVHQIQVGMYYLPIAVLMDGIMLYFVVSSMLGDHKLEGFKKAFHASNYYLLFILVSIWIAFI
ncbi:MAG: heme o synthase [Thermoplasmataceae archaeon]